MQGSSSKILFDRALHLHGATAHSSRYPIPWHQRRPFAFHDARSVRNIPFD
jgi:hypothetical protein